VNATRCERRPPATAITGLARAVTVQASGWQLTLGHAAAALRYGYHIMHLVLTI
jgi:hypothetical protein